MRINPYLKKIFLLIKPHNKILLYSIICMILVAISEGLIPKIVKDLLDNGFGGEFKGKVWQIPTIIIGLALFRSIGQFGSQYYTNSIAQKVSHKLRCDMFYHITHANMQSLSKYQSASLINIVIFEVLQILNSLFGVLIILVKDSITLCVLLFYLLWLNWQLALVVAVILPPIALLVTIIKKRLKKLNKLQHEFTNDSAYQVEQVFKNIKIVKSYNTQEFENNKFSHLSDMLQKFSMKIAIASGINQPITQMLSSIALAIVIGVAIYQSNKTGTTVGEFTSFLIAMLLIISPLKRLSDVYQPLQRSLNACEHVFAILDLSLENKEINKTPLDNLNIAINIQDLTIKYGNVTALENITMHIPAQKHIAIVGSSGSGKSTLLQVLLGFVPIDKGEIYINVYEQKEDKFSLTTKNIKQINIRDLREYISYIGQDIILFNRSIAQNIAYGKEIDDERLVLSLKNAFLYEFVESLEHGINTIVGDSGCNLSGGQKQRLSIARAFYKNSPILLLDEATSALDGESEEQIQLALVNISKNKTIISVAHRLHTITHADNIIVLNEGKIVEQGLHSELLNNNAYYAKLYNNSHLE